MKDDKQADQQVDEVATFMHQHELVLATAESCTAGLIAATLADIPGAGALLDCAYVVYSVRSKQHCVGVQAETLQRHNLTSEAVAREMAAGALKNSHANVAIANTGVTDDTDPSIAPGTQCFAWAFKRPNEPDAQLFSETRKFNGERNEIRTAAALYALTRLPGYYSKAG
ncbi:MAG TPA: CinA family protein [Burkholderiaceae bacterium]|nr:CinA family protein [Burkholderiaceae bacterium]